MPDCGGGDIGIISLWRDIHPAQYPDRRAGRELVGRRVLAVIGPAAHVPGRPEDIADERIPVMIDMRGGGANQTIAGLICIVNYRIVDIVSESCAVTRRVITKKRVVNRVPPGEIAIYVKTLIAFE